MGGYGFGVYEGVDVLNKKGLSVGFYIFVFKVVRVSKIILTIFCI